MILLLTRLRQNSFVAGGLLHGTLLGPPNDRVGVALQECLFNHCRTGHLNDALGVAAFFRANQG